MPRKEISSGSIFHHWKVIKYIGPINKEKHWQCTCICGLTRNVAERGLLRGTSKSCGCYQKTVFWHKLPADVALLRELFRKYRKQALERNLLFNLKEDEFKKLISQNCNYCDIAPYNKINHKTSNGFLIYNGIDRVNNDKGYDLENSVSCCKICNIMKNNLPLEVFLNHIQMIAKKHPERKV